MFVLLCEAEQSFLHCDFAKCLRLTESALEIDPHAHIQLAALHTAVLVELKRPTDLFRWAHSLSVTRPGSAVAYYTVACYYLLTSNFENARRFFNKATCADASFAQAWIGYGHSFAIQGDLDQALTAYRAALRAAPSSSMPLLCLGMQYCQASNFTLALHFLTKALECSPFDPLVHHELGTLAYFQRDYSTAIDHFERALHLCRNQLNENWEPTLTNQAHCYRKLGRYEQALETYAKALRLCPRNASLHTAIGFTFQIKGMVDNAVDHYHQSLALRPGDTFTSQMLSRALDPAWESNTDWLPTP